ncbi:hypothetical protein EDB86DRAFT_3083758 [Lactarius hatsudake]|nr:hypothetical protein EDB86DRAFT_3083758 [Lactarius hatsudake]
MLVADFLHTLTGLIPAPFSRDPAQAQLFINEFEHLMQVNRCNLLITRPKLRVELTLAFIVEDPMTTAWKHTIQRSTKPTDELIWDKFFDLFCIAWIDKPLAPMPETQTLSPPVPAPAALHTGELQVVEITDQTVTPPPRPYPVTPPQGR